MTFRTHILSLLLLPVLCSIAFAQFSVSPTRVMLDMQNRTAELNVINSTSDVLEITTSIGFKLIRSDSLGNLTLDSMFTDEEGGKSCERWLKVFPKKFTVAPRSTRVVRVLIQPPGNVKDGEYWGRLAVAGAPIEGEDMIQETVEGITTNLKTRLELDLPVIFRKGDITTGVQFGGVKITRQESGEFLGLLDMVRTGNSAYRGTVHASVHDASGEEIANVSAQFTTEFVLRKQIELPNLENGVYLLTIEAVSEKKGSAMDAVIPAETVIKSYQLQVEDWGATVIPR